MWGRAKRDDDGCGRQRRARLLVTALVAAGLAVPAVVLSAPSAQAATATISGGHTAGGLTYARQGDVLTLSVSTRLGNGGQPNAACVAFHDVTTPGSPAFLGSVFDKDKSSRWTFQVTAPAGADATRTIRATPFTNTRNGLPGNVRQGSSASENYCGAGTDPEDPAATVSYRLRNTPPTIVGAHRPASGTPAPQGGWYRGDVTVGWTCADRSGTGLASPGCPADATVTGEGADLSRTGSVTDNVGNSSSATVSGIRIDRTAPLTTADAPSGWQRHGVTVTLSASDALSGVATTQYSLDDGETWSTGTSVALGEGRHELQYRSTDVAGNEEAVRSASVDIDLTAPTITPDQDPAKPASGWNKDDVTVSFSCADNLSGVRSCSGEQVVTAEGTTSVPGAVEDNAGHSTAISHPVSIDRTAPVVTATQSGVQGKDGWYRSNVSVTFSCTDPGFADAPRTGSGIATCATESIVSTEGAGNSVTGNATDAAGNPGSATVSGIKVDQTAPVTESDAPAGWQKDDVTVTFSATDQEGLSGVDHTEYSRDGGRTWTRGTSVTFGPGVHDFLFRSADNAGNVEQPKAGTVRVDQTPPTITGSADRSPVDGWYDDDVTVSFTCGDEGGAGLAADCPGPVTLGEGDDQVVERTVSDNAGNSAATSVGPIRVDKTAPVTTADNPTGWQKDAVTVTLSASDHLSGVAGTEYRVGDVGPWTAGTSVALGEGRHTLQYRSTDVAGNVEDTNSVEVDVDMSAPTIEAAQDPGKNTAGWNNTDVTVSFTCGDALSGSASCTAPSLVSAEGDTGVTGTATDNAGNTSSIEHVVRIDKTAPTISGSASGTPGANGWYVSPVDVTFACDDDRSGIATDGCTGSTTLEQGAAQGATGTARDAAGNTATDRVSGVDVDWSEPTTTSDAPEGWQAVATTVTFTGQDQAGLSGVDYTEYSLDGGTTWTRGGRVTLGDGTHVLLFRSADRAGNVEEPQRQSVLVDLTGPSVSLSGPATTSSTTATLSGTAGDSGSGLAGVSVGTEALAVGTDGSFQTTVTLACGSNTFTATATDGVGRTATAAHSVTRTCATPVPAPVWTTQGFFAPVDMPTSTKKVVNSVKGGSTVPLKFRVYKDGVEQKDTAVVTGLKVAVVACDSGAVLDTVEQVATGSTSLRYDGSQFVQNWKTPTAVGCYAASAQLVNGSAITADFKVTK